MMTDLRLRHRASVRKRGFGEQFSCTDIDRQDTSILGVRRMIRPDDEIEATNIAP